MSDSSSEPSRERGTSVDRAVQLQHVTVEQGDVAVCTMFPASVDENAMSTQWITATADSFVALERQR